ncbi:MAG: sigma-54-dependent Fis family transcriptional regulator [Deltaproteobacteria bacterium]|nr:sigma-54-dependent Fis family transcriptional regulator [Deltaproteobacteria bacterium]MBW2130595.1 sigma-54-dependent Fis family transcriptional regulator [Deltaproteobacteria bacterium]MBW2304852.1 sigma-54-dependent Fis family transcriptional regulator [Deltaproteobacteria bacterium]
MDEKMSIMIVDDEMIIRESFIHWFRKYGHRVEAAASGSEALEKLEKTAFDLLFVDIKMPGMDGIELLERIKEEYPDTIVVIITAYGSIDTAVKAMKLGATDYLLKPFKPEQVTLVMQKVAQQRALVSQCRYLRDRIEEMTRFDNIIGQSPKMEEIFRLIPEVAQSNSSILIVGETGTGKELIAKAIHAKSPRANGPFVAINCGALPDTLLESELFGYRKGAFTGAVSGRKGYLDIVSGGTLFLDEIGEISPKMQVDLLRVLEEKKITRIGDRHPIDVDFRLISATRRNLEKAVAQGNFREDFYYRINVIMIRVPPLRERKEDIPLLVQHFLQKYSRETAKRVDHIDREAMEILKRYDWPGNVRELENAIERAVVLSKSRTLGSESFSFLAAPQPLEVKRRSLREVERRYIEKVLEECGWNVTRAAEVLDINRVTLHKMIKRYGLQRPS